MAEAPDGNETLTPDDAVDILEELLPAQNKSYELGLKFKLEPHVVEAIHSKDLSPDKYLLKILIKFLQQADRPTWRVIVEALRSPVVGLSALARRVEAAHFPDFTSSRDVVPETTTAATTATVKVQPEPSLSPSLPQEPSPQSSQLSPVTDSDLSQPSVEAVKEKVKNFRRKFNAIKKATIQCLEKHKIAVTMVVFLLTSIRAVDEHKMFLEEKHKKLRKCEDHWELFGDLDMYWNYLAFDLLEQLVENLNLEEAEFDSIYREMADYKRELEQFRRSTALDLFCQAESSRIEANIPEGFREIVVQFNWPEEVMLEKVEEFRQRYARSYHLQKCAMMVYSIGKGSFTITWFVPDPVVEKVMKTRAPVDIFKEFNITRIDIDGSCFYKRPTEQKALPPSSSDTLDTDPSAEKKQKQERASSDSLYREPTLQTVEDEDYRFAEQPSKDFFCPVTMGLLLQPHLTSCCGNHLSQEAAARIRGEKKACPLCNKQNWSTMLSKHFQRQVKSLRVFCRHEDRGCGWQGELAALPHHVQFCPMSGGPLMTELLKLPVYSERETVSGAERTTASGAGPPPTRSLTQPGLLATAVPQSIPAAVRPGKLTVKCHRKKTAPHRMERGSATTDGRYAYFTTADSTSAYQCQYDTEKWETLPSCPHLNSGLAVINGELTAVGGGDRRHCTNKLLTLRQRKWVEEYPPMITARSHPAVVSTSDGDHLIVTGGHDDGGLTAAVELFQVKIRKWYRMSDLPQPLLIPSATICGDQLNVIGWEPNGYSCSLQALPSSDQPITSPLTLSWNPLPTLPVIQSTAATFCGQLVIIGGDWQHDWSAVNSIHQLVEGQWVEIGSMASDRRLCLVVSLSPDKLIIVGGWSRARERFVNYVEECA